jgi:hypothetical protein
VSRAKRLDREIAESLARSKRHHATKRDVSDDAWEVAMDAILEHRPKKAAQIWKSIRDEHGFVTAPTSFLAALHSVPEDVFWKFQEYVAELQGRQPSLYSQIVAAGIPTDHHESDLYVLDTPAARRILAAHDQKWTRFRDTSGEKQGEDWLEVPFAYDPFWEEKAKKAKNRPSHARRRRIGAS